MAARLLLGLLVLLRFSTVQAGCAAESGSRTVALVELYTSERCSRCPAADRWLSRLGSRSSPDELVALTLHVDYADYLGRTDPSVRRRASERQRGLSVLQRMALVYTPQVLLQGRDFGAWERDGFEDAVKRINEQPARARLKAEIRPSSAGRRLAAAVRAEVDDPAQRTDAVLYLAAFQSRLQGEGGSGENAGRSLARDYVVLEWQGPFAMPADGRLVKERNLALLPGATAEVSGVAAFVQNRRTAEVLQALLVPPCSP